MLQLCCRNPWHQAKKHGLSLQLTHTRSLDLNSVKTKLKGKAWNVNFSLAWAGCPALIRFPVTSFRLESRTYCYVRSWRNLFSSQKPHVLWKLEIHQWQRPERVWAEESPEGKRKTKMPQRHFMGSRAMILLLRTIQVLIYESISRAQFPHQLPIISHPSLQRKASSVGYWWDRERAVGRNFHSLITDHLPAPGAFPNLFFTSTPWRWGNKNPVATASSIPTLTFNSIDKPKQCIKQYQINY